MQVVDELKDTHVIQDNAYLKMCNAVKQVQTYVQADDEPSAVDEGDDDATDRPHPRVWWSDNRWRTANDIRVRGLKKLYNRLLEIDRGRFQIMKNRVNAGVRLLDKLSTLRNNGSSGLLLSSQNVETLKRCMDINDIGNHTFQSFELSDADEDSDDFETMYRLHEQVFGQNEPSAFSPTSPS